MFYKKISLDLKVEKLLKNRLVIINDHIDDLLRQLATK